ncbi:MAG: hypothetical protein B7Y93_08285 [Micrococcales bacterium 32-70-13]|nr:MAG: hypothetical protein B7Y93_08285 [Micrococcales bacterium 32-70-13]
MRGVQIRITDGVGRQIIGGRYEPGDLLPKEAELASEFEVSRTSVREGMRVLAAKGLVEIRQKIGTTVRQPEHWSVFDSDVLRWHHEAGRGDEIERSLAEVRCVLEPAAARLAADYATPDDLRRLQTAIEQMASSPADAAAHDRAVGDFHETVCRASRNVLMRHFGSVVSELGVASRGSLHAASAGRKVLSPRLAAYRDLLQAITDRNGPAAGAAMLVVLEAEYS